MEQGNKKGIDLLCCVLAVLCIVFVANTAVAQEPVVRFSTTRMTIGEALRTLDLQGDKTVAANLSEIDLTKEISIPRTEGNLTEMTEVVMTAAGLKYRITDTHIIVLPAQHGAQEQAQAQAEATVAPRFNTPAIPAYTISSKEERVSATGNYKVLSVSLPGKQKQEVEYPTQEIFEYVPLKVVQSSKFAIKTNFLYAATLTANAGIEFSLGKKSTMDISVGYNFYESSNNKRWQHWMVQPEYRWWFCERFNGAFIGGHLLGGQFSFAKINLPFNVFPGLKDNRYEGEFFGGGVVFGYEWILGKRWNLEAAIGAGYVRVWYDKYACSTCGPAIDKGAKNYFGPTKASVSLIFFL